MELNTFLTFLGVLVSIPIFLKIVGWTLILFGRFLQMMGGWLSDWAQRQKMKLEKFQAQREIDQNKMK